MNEATMEMIVTVANHIVNTAIKKTTSGNYILGHDDVADLISHEDYDRYFDQIFDEVSHFTNEILDIQEDRDGEQRLIDLMVGLAWCKNYEPDDEGEVDWVKGVDYGYEEFVPHTLQTRSPVYPASVVVSSFAFTSSSLCDSIFSALPHSVHF